MTYITLGPGLAAAYFWNRGLLLGSNRAGVFINLMPIFSGAIAWLVLGEVFAWYHLVGLIIIISGISLVTRKRASITACDRPQLRLRIASVSPPRVSGNIRPSISSCTISIDWCQRHVSSACGLIQTALW